MRLFVPSLSGVMVQGNAVIIHGRLYVSPNMHLLALVLLAEPPEIV